MPGFKYDSGDTAFSVGIAQNETVLPAVFHEPLLCKCVDLALIQIHIFGGIDIRGKSQLMFAGSGHCYGSSCHGFRLFLPIAHIEPSFDLLVKKIDLRFMGSVS